MYFYGSFHLKYLTTPRKSNHGEMSKVVVLTKKVTFISWKGFISFISLSLSIQTFNRVNPYFWLTLYIQISE